MAKRKAARVTGRKAASSSGSGSRKKAGVKKKAARAGATRKAAKKAAKSAPRKKAGASARKAAPKGSARKAAKATKKAAVKKAPARKAVAKKTAVKKAAPKKATAAKSPARKAAAKAVARTSAPPKPQLTRKAPALDRARRTIQDDDIVPSPPSSLDLDRHATSARSGRREMAQKFSQHNESSPALTAGDVDADWEGAYASGDEAPGGDNPTPDQDIVDDIGKAVGNVYQDNEELKGADKITKRDKHRWELDPASAEDYDDRDS